MRLVALMILTLIRHLLAGHKHRFSLPRCWPNRPALPAGFMPGEAPARGRFGNAIARMCRRRGIGPGHADWPELARAIVAFGGSLRGFTPGAAPTGLYWWENPGFVPGMIGETAAPPSAAAIALRQAEAEAAPAPAAPPVITEAGGAPFPAVWMRPSWRQGPVRPGTGPPTGPPAALAAACTR